MKYRFEYLLRKIVYTEIKQLLKNYKNFAIIKGDALSMQAYNNCGLRNMSDIDILLSKKTYNQLKPL